MDLATLVVLYPLKVSKEQRQLLITGMRMFASRTESDLQSKQQPLNFAKYGQGSLKITPQTPLPPGEHAITVQTQGTQPTAYCFGVDAAHRWPGGTLVRARARGRLRLWVWTTHGN